MWHAVLLSLLIACGNKNSPPPEAPPDGTEKEAPSDETDGVVDGEDDPKDGEEDPDAAEEPTPESLYAECKDRVEGKQVEGECKTDADCATAGCGNEVCLTKANAGDVMTTCEDKLCFKVLDTCGCVEGQCSWSLKDEVPAMENTPKLPPNRLPPTPPPAEDGTEEGDAPAEEAEGGEDAAKE